MEWANLVTEALPAERLDVMIEGSGINARTVTIEPHGRRYKEVFYEDPCI